MKIICIGRNYLIIQLNLTIKCQKSRYFSKPQTAIQPKNHPFFIPDFSNHIEYELEIVIRINKLENTLKKNLHIDILMKLA